MSTLAPGMTQVATTGRDNAFVIDGDDGLTLRYPGAARHITQRRGVPGGGDIKKRRAPPDFGGALRFCSDRQLSWAGRYSTLLVRSLSAETVEFSVSCAAEKCMPFVRCKPENRPFGVPAVADTIPPSGRLATSTQLPLARLSELLTQ